MTLLYVTPVSSTDAPALWSGPSTRSLVATTLSTVHTIFHADASSFQDVAAKGFDGAIQISVGATISPFLASILLPPATISFVRQGVKSLCSSVTRGASRVATKPSSAAKCEPCSDLLPPVPDFPPLRDRIDLPPASSLCTRR